MPPLFTDPLPSAPRPAWLRATDLLIAVLLVLAVALISSFLGVSSARAQPASEALGMGEQKSASEFVLHKDQRRLEQEPAAPASTRIQGVEWHAGPQLPEGPNVGALDARDVGDVGGAPLEAPLIFAQTAGAKQASLDKRKRRQAAEIIARHQGVPVAVLELALRRDALHVQPITSAVAKGQQSIAHTFHAPGLLPRSVRDSKVLLSVAL